MIKLSWRDIEFVLMILESYVLAILQNHQMNERFNEPGPYEWEVQNILTRFYWRPHVSGDVCHKYEKGTL